MRLKSYLRGLGTGLFISAVLMGIATSGKGKDISDSEIRQRAAALGMVDEDSVLLKPAAEETADDKKEEAVVSDAEDKKEDNTGSKVETEDKSTEEKPGEDKQEATEAEDEAVNETDSEDNDIRDSKEDRAMGGQASEDNSEGDNGTMEDDKTPMLEPKEEQSSQEKVSGLQNSSDKLGYNEFFTIQIASGSSSETVSGLLKRGGAIDDADEFDDFLCKNHYDKKISPGVFKIPVGADYGQIAEIITGNR